jgi:hypothetical protein
MGQFPATRLIPKLTLCQPGAAGALPYSLRDANLFYLKLWMAVFSSD